MSGSHSSSDDSNDSRKRPPDQVLYPDSSPKRANCDENVHLKVLIPSIAAGAVIGKSGEAIGKIQKDTNTKVKISKQDEFYPGTTERVCLIIGSMDGVMTVHNYIMDRIMEKPDPNPHATGEGRLNVERHKQVKILVPNSTAGMVIGKGGMYIQEIKDKTGAYVQISQKSREFNLPERCIIIAGDLDQARSAVHMILGVIAADPQSASCPNLSYHDVRGPVASVYPTGSPYATPVVQCPANAAWLTGSPVDIAAANTAAMMAAMLTPNALTPLGAVAASRNAAFGFFSPSYPATPDLASLAALASSPVAATAAAAALGMTPMLQAAPPPPPALASPVASGGDLAATMSASFTSSSTHSADFVGSPLDPSGAVAAAAQQAALLASFRSKAQLLPHDSSQMGDPAASPGAFLSQSPFMTGPLHMPSSTLLGYPAAVGGGGYPATVPAQQGFIAPKAGQIETHSSPTSGASGTSSASSSPSIAASVALAALSAAAANSSSCSNPVGVLPNPGTLLGVVQTPLSTLNLSQLVPQPLRADQLSLSMGSLSSTPPSLLLALSEAGSALPAMSPGIGSSANSPQGTAALPTSASVFGLYALPSPNPSISTSPVGPLGSYVVCKRVISIPDNVIGLILGPQGRSIIDLQSATGTLIQISQKGVYVPGTQNRLVTITGAQPNVQWAASVIEQRIAIEQLRRDTGSSQTNTVPQIPSAEPPELQQQQQQQQGLPLFYPHASPLGLYANPQLIQPATGTTGGADSTSPTTAAIQQVQQQQQQQRQQQQSAELTASIKRENESLSYRQQPP